MDEAVEVASTARAADGLDAGNLPEKEIHRRDQLRAKVRAELMAYGEVAEAPGSIPGLVLHPGNVSESPVGPIPYSDLSRIAEKFGRGCEYKLMNRCVEPPYGLRTFISHPDEIRAEVDGEQWFDLVPWFKVKCVRHAENPGDVAYWFLLWDTVCLKVFIAFESVLVELEPKFSRPLVEVARTDSPPQQSASAQVGMPDWKQSESEVADGRFPLDRYLGDSKTITPLATVATAATKPATRKLRPWYYVAGFTFIVAASAVVGLLGIPRVAAPVMPMSEPVRPLPTSASPGATPSEPAPASEGAPPVLPTSKTQTQNVLVTAQDEIARRVLPDIPAKARNTIHGTVRVVVRVTVDPAGSVAEVTLEPGSSRYFGRLAVEAARRWEFAPAEGALPRNWILSFKISRTSTQVIPRRAKN